MSAKSEKLRELANAFLEDIKGKWTLGEILEVAEWNFLTDREHTNCFLSLKNGCLQWVMPMESEPVAFFVKSTIGMAAFNAQLLLGAACILNDSSEGFDTFAADKFENFTVNDLRQFVRSRKGDLAKLDKMQERIDEIHESVNADAEKRFRILNKQRIGGRKGAARAAENRRKNLELADKFDDLADGYVTAEQTTKSNAAFNFLLKNLDKNPNKTINQTIWEAIQHSGNKKYIGDPPSYSALERRYYRHIKKQK